MRKKSSKSNKLYELESVKMRTLRNFKELKDAFNLEVLGTTTDTGMMGNHFEKFAEFGFKFKNANHLEMYRNFVYQEIKAKKEKLEKRNFGELPLYVKSDEWENPNIGKLVKEINLSQSVYTLSFDQGLFGVEFNRVECNQKHYEFFDTKGDLIMSMIKESCVLQKILLTYGYDLKESVVYLIERKISTLLTTDTSL